MRRCLPIVLGLGSKKAYFSPTRARTLSKAELALLILLCGGMALALSFFLQGGCLKPAAPAIFLLLIISVGHFWGRLASLLVATAGGLVFAEFLFEPYGISQRAMPTGSYCCCLRSLPSPS